MKSICILITVLFLNNAFAQNNKVIKIPIKIENGYGPFDWGFGRISINDTNNNILNTWHKTYLPIKGFPLNWKNYKYGYIWLDAYQFAYQNYKQGKITEQDYQGLQKDWKWTPDETKLSAQPIKCYVYCAWNIDENGHMGEMILDANNNLDFSDDSIFIAPELKDFNFKKALKNARYFKAQQYLNGKITDVRLPLAITLNPHYVFYNIPLYGKAVLKTDKKTYKFAINSSNFSRADFTDAKMLLVKNYEKKVHFGDILNKGEYITLDKKVYKYSGVDMQEKTMNLQEISDTSNLFSIQIGYKTFPFSGKEINTGATINLDQYKGKYLLIDFWGTWCTPCREEIPNLKNAYNKLDKSKISFLSIALDNEESLKKYITAENLEWPQILSDKENKIVETYGINSYPTSLLIDPTGKIIAKNIRGEKLTENIAKLMK